MAKATIGFLFLIITEFVIFATPILETIGFDEFKRSIGIIFACFFGCFALIRYAIKGLKKLVDGAVHELKGFKVTLDHAVEEIKGVKIEMHSLNVKVGDVALGLDMAKKSYETRFAENEVKTIDLTQEVFRLRDIVHSLKELVQSLIGREEDKQLPHN